MPEGSKLVRQTPQRFQADRNAGRHEAFVARFLPVPPAETRPRPGPEPQSGPASPHAAPAPALVAADLRSARARQRPADAAPPPRVPVPPAGEDTAAGPSVAAGGPPAPAAEVSPAHDPAELERRLADAREQGHEQGRAQALEQLAAERAGLAQAAKALAAALARLERPSPDQVAVLARAMDAAVTRLATERAGIAIDRAPAGFARRVSRLAERLACHPGRVTVRLHPDDLAAIQPFLADDGAPDISALAGARLVGDPGLQRGDADLETAGIRIADLAGTDAGDDGE